MQLYNILPNPGKFKNNFEVISKMGIIAQRCLRTRNNQMLICKKMEKNCNPLAWGKQGYTLSNFYIPRNQNVFATRMWIDAGRFLDFFGIKLFLSFSCFFEYLSNKKIFAYRRKKIQKLGGQIHKDIDISSNTQFYYAFLSTYLSATRGTHTSKPLVRSRVPLQVGGRLRAPRFRKLSPLHGSVAWFMWAIESLRLLGNLHVLSDSHRQPCPTSNVAGTGASHWQTPTPGLDCRVFKALLVPQNPANSTTSLVFLTLYGLLFWPFSKARHVLWAPF